MSIIKRQIPFVIFIFEKRRQSIIWLTLLLYQLHCLTIFMNCFLALLGHPMAGWQIDVSTTLTSVSTLLWLSKMLLPTWGILLLTLQRYLSKKRVWHCTPLFSIVKFWKLREFCFAHNSLWLPLPLLWAITPFHISRKHLKRQLASHRGNLEILIQFSVRNMLIYSNSIMEISRNEDLAQMWWCNKDLGYQYLGNRWIIAILSPYRFLYWWIFFYYVPWKLDRISKTKKNPRLHPEQIRHEYWQCYRRQHRFVQFRPDRSEPIAVFAQADGTLHFNLVGIVPVFCRYIRFRIFIWPSEFRTRQSDVSFSAILPVSTRPVDLVCTNHQKNDFSHTNDMEIKEFRRSSKQADCFGIKK